MPSRAPFRLIFLLAAGLPACGSKESVALGASIFDPSVEVERSAVGSDVTGGFELELTLGDYAEDSTQVTLGTFAIQRDGVDVLAPLSLGGTEFPVTLAVGSVQRFSLTFLQSPPLDVADSLCEGDLEFFGSLTDSLSGDRSTTVRSGAFEPSCPP